MHTTISVSLLGSTDPHHQHIHSHVCPYAHVGLFPDAHTLVHMHLSTEPWHMHSHACPNACTGLFPNKHTHTLQHTHSPMCPCRHRKLFLHTHTQAYPQLGTCAPAHALPPVFPCTCWDILSHPHPCTLAARHMHTHTCPCAHMGLFFHGHTVAHPQPGTHTPAHAFPHVSLCTYGAIPSCPHPGTLAVWHMCTHIYPCAHVGYSLTPTLWHTHRWAHALPRVSPCTQETIPSLPHPGTPAVGYMPSHMCPCARTGLFVHALTLAHLQLDTCPLTRVSMHAQTYSVMSVPSHACPRACLGYSLTPTPAAGHMHAHTALFPHTHAQAPATPAWSRRCPGPSAGRPASATARLLPAERSPSAAPG